MKAILLPDGTIETTESEGHTELVIYLLETGRVTEAQVENYELEYGDLYGTRFVSKGRYKDYGVIK